MKVQGSFLRILTVALLLLSFAVSHPKGDKMRQRTIDSTDGLIQMNSKFFNEFVMKHPRPYDVVILFTLRHKCSICEKVREQLSSVAESYHAEGAFKPNMVDRKRAIFFAVMYYSEDTSSIYKRMKLPSTTSILYTAPQNILLDDSNNAYIKYDEDFVMAFKDRRETVMAHKILEFVNAKARRKVELKKNPVLFLFYFVCFVGVLALGVYAFTAFHSFFMSPYLWLVGSLAVFIICQGGIVYNIIHGTPFAKFDRNGHIKELIHPGQRSQYVGEGILMSSMFVISGLLFVALTWINKFVRGEWKHRFLAIFIIMAIMLLSKVIIVIYQKKAGWYGPTFFPPEGYTQGPLIKDQGNSF